MSKSIPPTWTARTLLSILALLVATFGASGVDAADLTYRVTIENLTPANGGGASQVLSPSLVVAHDSSVNLFTVGQMANQSVIDVAEDAIGATGVAAYSGNPGVAFVGYMGSPLPPGQSLHFDFIASDAADMISLVSMLVNTNDGFTGLDAVPLPRLATKGPESATTMFMVMGYDAGSEVNDQLLANIPGPCCGDAGRHGTDETMPISHHPGILDGVGQLDPATWGWPVDQPVARITIENITPTPTQATTWSGIKTAGR